MAADIVNGPGQGAKNAEPAQPRDTKRQYFPELQGIRAIAVLAVITVHSAFTAGKLGFLTYHPENGVLAVVLERFTRESLPILFGLSGFLIYRPFALATIADARKPELGAYAWRRALRIIPAFWLVSIIVMFTIGRDQVSSVWYALRVLSMQHVYQAGAIPQGLEATWSMATETAFYVFLPLFAWLFARLARRTADPAGRARRILLPIGILILIGYAFGAWSHSAAVGPYPVQGNWPIGWVGYLAVGMGLATLSAAAETSPNAVLAPYRLVAKYPGWCWFAALIVLILFCFSPAGGQGTADYPTLTTFLFDQPVDLLLVFLLLAPLTVPGVRSRVLDAVLTVKPLQFIGKVSYGMFLWHIPFLYFYNGSLVGGKNFPLTWAVVMGGSFLAAVVSYYAVEKPALRLRNTFGKSSAQPSIPVLTTS
ncbi:acyltransferase [Planotetraspora sp. A-T 1434]|uniref:acyltransferase family protein n=1 Tax=Planotetraspora sp. A-T 1434 TaxID=2979219 RepID=UPI0021BF2E5B|nr:acyltransferase [Planotetraspora sp. A-T 1434]MCT9933194.1 acyltransferase [Planotetraspora sp. A-T 1434]